MQSISPKGINPQRRNHFGSRNTNRYTHNRHPNIHSSRSEWQKNTSQRKNIRTGGNRTQISPVHKSQNSIRFDALYICHFIRFGTSFRSESECEAHRQSLNKARKTYVLSIHRCHIGQIIYVNYYDSHWFNRHIFYRYIYISCSCRYSIDWSKWSFQHFGRDVCGLSYHHAYIMWEQIGRSSSLNVSPNEDLFELLNLAQTDFFSNVTMTFVHFLVGAMNKPANETKKKPTNDQKAAIINLRTWASVRACSAGSADAMKRNSLQNMT